MSRNLDFFEVERIILATEVAQMVLHWAGDLLNTETVWHDAVSFNIRRVLRNHWAMSKGNPESEKINEFWVSVIVDCRSTKIL